MEREAVVAKFRSILNDFKSPYLLKLEEEPLEDSADIQDMNQINTMLREFDILYKTLKAHIQNPGEEVTDIPTKAILSVFEKANIFSAIRVNPSWKDDLLYILGMDLKIYPFTRSVEHLQILEKNNVESHQRKIVPNLE